MEDPIGMRHALRTIPATSPRRSTSTVNGNFGGADARETVASDGAARSRNVPTRGAVD